MSVVLDASAACSLLLGRRGAGAIDQAIRAHSYDICAPHLLDLEVLSVLRRKLTAGELTVARAEAAVEDLADLAIARYPHESFSSRIWELRANFTPYDGAYVTLAEALEGAELLTADAPLARAARRHSGASVQVVAG